MRFINILTQETTLPAQLNGRQNCTWENSRAELSAAGWREYYPSDTPNIRTSHWQDTGTAYTQIVDAVWSAEELAQQAAEASAAQAKAAADQAKADAEAQAKFAAEEDARIMALPSVAALKARLATNEAAVVKLSADVAAKVTPK
jgi:hypothetical protein